MLTFYRIRNLIFEHVTKSILLAGEYQVLGDEVRFITIRRDYLINLTLGATEIKLVAGNYFSQSRFQDNPKSLFILNLYRRIRIWKIKSNRAEIFFDRNL